MTDKLTPWFPGDVKPARPGAYQRRFHQGNSPIFFSRWDGETWRGVSSRPEGVAKTRASAVWMRLEWRGLAADPEA